MRKRKRRNTHDCRFVNNKHRRRYRPRVQHIFMSFSAAVDLISLNISTWKPERDKDITCAWVYLTEQTLYKRMGISIPTELIYRNKFSFIYSGIVIYLIKKKQHWIVYIPHNNIRKKNDIFYLKQVITYTHTHVKVLKRHTKRML